MIWNFGELPDDWTIKRLLAKHPSIPYNPDIANTFFRSGYVEAWGRGFTKMIEQCQKAGLPAPVYEDSMSGFWAVFRKDIYHAEYLKKLRLNDRQIKAVLYVKENGKISNIEYQTINDIKKTVSASELQDLTERKILIKIGNTGRGIKYILANQ